MKTRVTQSDVARVAGVHNTTVSLALRNSPAIPEATRKRIQGIAEELGYYPDPALQALVAYRKGRMANRRLETIAYVTNWTTRWGWQDITAHAKAYAGAQRKAAQSGFQLEHFWFGEPGMSQRRLASMLYHRGINGIVLASHRADSDDFAEMDWSRLSAVKIGCFPHPPALHRIAFDHGGAIRLAMRRVIAAGYRRIGVALPRAWDDFAEQACSSGFLAEQSRLPLHHRVPILLYGSPGEGPAIFDQGDDVAEVRAIGQWFQRHNPDVIVGVAPCLRTCLEKLGLQVPRDVACVDLFVEGADGGVAGVRENYERVGEIATELLVAQMQQNLFGLPAIPTTTLVEGQWCEGESLPVSTLRTSWSQRSPDQVEYNDRNLLAVP